MQDYMISVVVPVYGAEEYLDKCVGSITAQTYKNIEIILVDDGSKDRSGEMCDEYAASDNRIKVIHKENGGLMSAWMEGTRNSSGEYLCFVDSDDWVDTDMIEKMSEYLTGKKEIICCNHLIERTSGQSYPLYHGAESGVYEGDDLQNKIKKQVLGNENRTVSFSRCMKLTKKELITENMHYCDTRIRMAEDVNIMLPAILDAERIVIMKDSCFYHYFYNDVSMTHGYDAGLNKNMEYLEAVMGKVLADKYEDKAQAEILFEKEKLFFFMYQMKNELRADKDVTKNLLALIKENNIKERVRRSPLVVKDRGNQLLYEVMKHPGRISVGALKLAYNLKNR